MTVPNVTDVDRIQVNIHVQAEVWSAKAAQRQANAWLLENAGNLLGTATPELIPGERLIWRIDIVLTSPSRGRLGSVGQIEIDATTGEVLADENLTASILPRAYALTEN